MKLFEKTQLGKLELQNKIVMAPMTRSRAIGNVPNPLMARYYAQRATAGLIITEGTSPSPNGLGYARIPGLFTVEQARGWREVTDAVHAQGAKIFVQLMHTGRVGHPANLPAGARMLAPSAVALPGQVWTDSQGQQNYGTPEEMTVEDIRRTIAEFVHASKLAVTEAGFDGVELHSANGYLLEQFLNPGSNRREDIYGTDRTEFVVQVAKAVAQAIGPEKTGIRLSPYGTFNAMAEFEGVDDFYEHLAHRLGEIGLVYVHVIDHGKGDVKRKIRQAFSGTYILAQGYDALRAEVDLTEKRGDLVAFGKPFIANPDFVEKMKRGLTLREMDASTLYTPGEQGYTDYLVG